MAVAAFGMLLTSCQNDLDFVQNAGETSTVSFSVGTPEIATRAYSDGLTAKVLQYAVYDSEGNILSDLTETDATINGSTTVNLQLTTGDSYAVIFWAAAENAPYTVNFDEKTMTVSYDGAKSNDETRDAFYKYHTFTVTGAQTETVELRRPFAQLNIGTSDYTASENAGYVPTTSAVTVKNVYTTLSLVDGAATGETEAVFAANAIPENEQFPVTGYEYLAMNYLLVNSEKEVVDVEFTYADANNDAKTRTVGSVPVQRNYRTNIFGSLLTGPATFNIVIDSTFNGEYPDGSLEKELLLAATVGGEVTLTEDVTLNAPLVVNADMVINLNGNTITGNYHKSIGAVINNTANLKLVGGTISSTGANGGSAIANYGELVVEGTAIIGASIRENGGWPSYPINNYGDMTLKNATITGYQGAVACGDAGTTILENCTINKEYLNTSSHVFYIYHEDAHVIVNGGTYTHNGMDGSLAYVINGSITVNDGTFSASNGGYGFAALSAGKVTINGGNINAGLLGWGGQFVVNGGVYTSDPSYPNNYLAEGLKAIKKDGKYYVVAEEVELVASETELQNALAAGSSILLYQDINVTKLDLTALTNDVVIDANGKTITTASNYGVQVKAGKNITLKNAKVEMTVEGNYITYAAGFKVENGDYQGNTITLKDCEIRMCNTDWAYAVNMPASVKNLNLVIDGCTLEGAVALQCWGDNNTINITNSNLICNYTTNAMYTSYCVALQGDGTNNSENNTLNISGCAFSYSGVDNYNSTIVAVGNHKYNGANTITVDNCTYGEKVKAY